MSVIYKSFLCAGNSGIKKILGIYVMNKSKQKKILIGDFLYSIVKKAQHRRRIKKKEFCLALVVALKNWDSRKDGSFFKQSSSKVLLYSLNYKKLWAKVKGVFNYKITYLKEKKMKELIKQLNFLIKHKF